jgi:alpha-ketoglutarate-dependent taurine dioxygenase
MQQRAELRRRGEVLEPSRDIDDLLQRASGQRLLSMVEAGPQLGQASLIRQRLSWMARRQHRETGKPILWVNFTQHPSIIGLDQAEGKELLTLIIDQYRKPEHQVRFRWRPGSVAFWDNRAAVHYAVRNYGDFPRLLERVLIADQPLYRDL